MFSPVPRIRSYIFILALLGSALSAAPLSAQLNGEVVESERSVVRPTASVERAETPRLDSSTKLSEIELDGYLDDPDWENARVFSGFTLREARGRRPCGAGYRGPHPLR